MTIGARLKEERVRLRQSQSAFAALAGATKSAQINWEKDQTSPNASALAAFAEAGADVLYILTGERTKRPINERSSFGAQDMLDNLERALRDPEGAALKFGSPMKPPEVREHVRRALGIIAISSSESSDDEVTEASRERADSLLRIYFDDDAAGRRRSARYAAVMEGRRAVVADLDDALNGLDLNLSLGLQQQLLMLLIDHRLTIRDLVPLLYELKGDLNAARRH